MPKHIPCDCGGPLRMTGVQDYAAFRRQYYVCGSCGERSKRDIKRHYRHEEGFSPYLAAKRAEVKWLRAMLREYPETVPTHIREALR